VWIDHPGEGATEGGLVAIGFIAVMAGAQLSGEPASLIAVLEKQRPGHTAFFCKLGAAVESVFIPVQPGRQALLVVEFEPVQPGGGGTFGDEMGFVGHVIIAVDVMVLVVAQLQTAGPALVDRPVAVSPHVGDAEFVVGVGVVIVEVVLSFASLVEQVDSSPEAVAEMMAEAGADTVVTVGVPVSIRTSRLLATVETVGFFGGKVSANAGTVIAAVDATAALPGLMAAISPAEAGVEPFCLTCGGKDLDHTSDGICAI